MEPTRPLARRRLERAIDAALGGNSTQEPSNLAQIQRKLSTLSQEKRFLLYAYLVHEPEHLTSQEIALGIKDLHSNVLRNLHVLTAERMLDVRKDADTGICRYAVDRVVAGQLSEFFAAGRTGE
ncbi:hypothetical protein HCU64_21140 [Methylobacterium sp. C25]|uniref:hypothetical protein n=1 Tax=Methylobacterium sp. C25 TaxID=2721622 RepID=UPI001F1A3D60|nr:hypothetical protein [Methylobacterium sp. C25]MCE4226260.1 hypothetical protein [Methylobacterium sp. C25]